MTRPKVPDDKRIRTAQACESCKRRKQKRNLVCDYLSGHGHGHSTPHHGGQGEIVVSGSSPNKRRKSTPDTMGSDEGSAPKRPRFGGGDVRTGPSSQQAVDATEPSRLLGLPTPIPAPPLSGQPGREGEAETEPEPEVQSRQSTVSGADEIAEVYTETRMLQDPTGRLLYLGDSATLSYLQFIRMIVESVDGPSQFTMDPSRHRLMELTTSLPPDYRTSLLLPDRRTADVLIRSYLTNQTNGLIEVFDRKIFNQRLEVCYQNPLAAEPTFLCLLYLVFAIGLVLATPAPGSHDDSVIKNLQTTTADRAEMFFMNAKCLCDPTSGFEDADFWSVQALLLMSLFKLARTKRNAAYAYHGMAVRSGFALGLHRQETMVIFPVPDRIVRRNVWRSLYVLDRFLAAALGRPTSISEVDCSAEALVTPERYLGQEKYLADTNTDPSSSSGLNAAVRSCQVIGIILKKIYAQRKTSTKLAQEISEQCKGGPQKYHAGLHWRQAMNTGIDPAHGMAVIHVNLLYCHAVILLTRPFFLFLMNRMQQERLGVPRAAIRPGSKMEKFSEACVNAAYHTVALVQMAHEGNYLPQRDPFIIHFLFAATLVVQSNEFASLHENPSYGETYQQALSIMTYCAKTDPQASRLVYIMTTFHNVIVSRAPATSSLRDPSSIPNTPSGGAASGGTLVSTPDPMANFFLSHSTPTTAATQHHAPTSAPAPASSSSSTFDPALSMPPHHHHQPQAPQPPGLHRRDSANTNNPPTCGPSPSPGMMPNALTPTTSSTGGDPLIDAEWFHFDSLWENWAATPQPPPAQPQPPSSAGAPSQQHQQQQQQLADPALFGDPAMGGFDVSGPSGGGGGPGSAFATTPLPGTQQGSGGMNVPLYPMIRFAE
ncbi:fungal specific transcription factor [Diaporthe eres]|nr:fungal specific transcription factor [Diaporthe eres]